MAVVTVLPKDLPSMDHDFGGCSRLPSFLPYFLDLLSFGSIDTKMELHWRNLACPCAGSGQIPAAFHFSACGNVASAPIVSLKLSC